MAFGSGGRRSIQLSYGRKGTYARNFKVKSAKCKVSIEVANLLSTLHFAR